MNSKKVILFMTGMLTVFIFLTMINKPTAAAQGEVTLDIIPKEVLFDVNNMKPGDWAPRTVVVQNNGKKAFDYVMTLKPDRKSMKLFNELLLEVKDARGEVYNGKLADFKQLDQRGLKPSKQEDIDFTIRFPTHLGNDFQGLDAKFVLVFSAEGNENNKDEKVINGMISGSDGKGDTNGSALPATATNIFSIILLGMLFIVVGGAFVLYNRKKVKIEEKP